MTFALALACDVSSFSLLTVTRKNDEREDGNSDRSEQRDRESHGSGDCEAPGPGDNGLPGPGPSRGGGPGDPAAARGIQLAGGGQTAGPGVAEIRPDFL